MTTNPAPQKIPSHGSEVQSQLVWQAPGPLRHCPRADTTVETLILTLVLSWEHWGRSFFTEILQAYVQLSSARCQLTNLPLLVYADYSGGHRTPKAEWGWTSPKTSSASLLPQTTPRHCRVLVTMRNYIRRYTDISKTFLTVTSQEKCMLVDWIFIPVIRDWLILDSKNHNYHKEK